MANQKIVVTDDDAEYLELMRELLTEEGYGPVVCVLNDRAYSTIRCQQPALALLDIHLEQQFGWQLLDKLRLDPTTAHIPVVICSTDPRLFNERAEDFRRLRCDFLAKPFNLESLVEKVLVYPGPGEAS
jgi:DNA-binding response OmpR family regulator